MLSELEKVSNDGYAIDDEECELGARCVAAPIRDYTGEDRGLHQRVGSGRRMTLQKIRW
jgi:DNA-binding IclR family transcriptional regulator